ncbi:MAG: MarR family transcriptional regulator [Rhodopseudomonas sp.]|nr:MarR family transcriptional regulator [Rhodopseudomonas sp.]
MYLLNQASLAVRSHLEAALRDLQMTGIQYTILGTIKDHEGISSAELSRRFFVTAQTTNEIINGLEQRGLITRKEDPANRRILRMKLTAQGRKLHDQCDRIADRIEAAAFGWVEPRDYEALREALRTLLKGLRERAPLIKPAAEKRRTSASST